MATFTPEQIAKRGGEIYEEKYKQQYEPQHNGKFLAIEVESGEAFLSESIEGAYQKAHEKFPDMAVVHNRIRLFFAFTI